MILRGSPSRPQVAGLLKQIKSCKPPSSQSRYINTPPTQQIRLPPLGVNNSNGNFYAENGVPGFLSPRTYRQTWSQYQASLVEQINEQVVDTEYSTKSPYQMHVEFSRQPEHANLYNICAMAHFNKFWWEGLHRETVAVPDGLLKDIEEDFHSLDNLRQEMLECGAAMFGNGFVWLMKENSSSFGLHAPLRILCTYNAGSPYSEAYRMRQNRDMATLHDPAAAATNRRNTVQNTAGSFGMYSRAAKEGLPPVNALQGTPILCLNVWQHMWIPDYGILGKNTYLAAWWERIDWNKVQERYNEQTRVSEGGYRGLFEQMSR